MEAFFWTFVFQFIVNILYYFFWPRVIATSLNVFSFLNTIKLKPSVYIKITFFVFFFPMIAFYYFYDSFDILWKAITAGRTGGASSGLLIQEPIGNSSSLMLPLNSIWQLTPMFSVIAFISSRKKFTLANIISLLLGFIVIFSFFLGGSRGSMMLVALLFCFLFSTTIGIRVLAFGIFYFCITISFYRDHGNSSSLQR